MRITEAFSNAFYNTIGKLFAEPTYGRSTLPNPDDLRNDVLYEEYAEEEGRQENLALYKTMDDESPEFCDALDSLSDLIIQGDDVQMNGYKLVSDNNSKQLANNNSDTTYNIRYALDATTPPTEAKKIEEILKAFEARTEIKYRLKYYIRSALKYGDYFGNIIYGETVKTKQRLIAEILDISPDKIIIHRDEYGRLSKEKPYELIMASTNDEPIFYKKHEMFRIQMGGMADYEYGRSLAHSARKIYQQLVSIETGMVVGRLTRSHQRYLYKIDTSNMAPDVALEYVNKIKRAMTKKKMVDRNGNLVYTKSPLTAEEDIYLPVKKDSNDGVELLKSDEFLKNIDDVKYFKDKYERILKIKRYGSSDSKGSRNAIAELDVDVVRYVKSVQMLVRYALERLYNMELALHGIKQKVMIEMPEIASTLTLRKWDVERLRSEICQIHKEAGTLSIEYLQEKVLYLNDEELAIEKMRREEAAAAALKLMQATAAANKPEPTEPTTTKKPQGGGAVRVTTGFKPKKLKKASNTYVTVRNRTEGTETEEPSKD